MKKVALSIVIILVVGLSLNAQNTIDTYEKDEPSFSTKNIIKILPLNALFGEVGIGYECIIKSKMSLNFMLAQMYSDIDSINSDGSVIDYDALFETELKVYLSKSKNTLEGLFVSGGVLGFYDFLQYKNNAIFGNRSFKIYGIGGSAKGGYQWVFKEVLKHFTLAIEGGVDYRVSISKLKYTNVGINTRLSLVIGCSW